jgi:two-component system nitrogen regulation sensor histidine kinase NtrY
VTLAQRLLVAIGILTIATTAALGLGVREAWRRTEDERFRAQFLGAFERLQVELREQIRDLPPLLQARCSHDNVVDSALVDLRAGRLDAGRRLSLSLQIPQMMKAMRLSELTLLTGDGDILGAGHAAGLVGTRDGALAAVLRQQPAELARIRTAGGQLAVVAHCVRASGSTSVGLVGARYIDHLLREVAAGHGVRLSLEPARPNPDELVSSVAFPELGGREVHATASRMPLYQALRSLDATILALGAGTFCIALVLAMLLSRGLAGPIVSLSRQAREAVRGQPRPVKGRGGRELKELADAFNQAISDLSAMRKRLAATERIAARREIARRVAHEIKNPLAPIRAAVETLRRLHARDDPAFDGYFDEATRTVLDEVARITNIVAEFTRFARLPPPNPAPLDLVDTVRKVVGLHSSSSVPIELHTEPCPEVIADQDQIVQVVTNLLQNALDACSAVPQPRLRVEVRPEGTEWVKICLTDNGPGVAPEMRDRLFEPYATTKAEGTGLGLAIVHRIVVEHAGEISYEDRPGGGAQFCVVLPVRGPTLLPEPPTSTPLGTRG